MSLLYTSSQNGQTHSSPALSILSLLPLLLLSVQKDCPFKVSRIFIVHQLSTLSFFFYTTKEDFSLVASSAFGTSTYPPGRPPGPVVAGA